MNALKQNPFLTALAAITIIACGVLIFLIVQASGRLTETLSKYDDQKREYERLIAAGTFPSEENLERLSEFQQQYAKEVVALRAEVEQRQMEVPSLTTTGFQDVLTKKVESTRQLAQEKNVELGEDFFLGFGGYRTSLPLQDAVPLLTLEMEVIDDVLTRILEAPAASITRVERARLPIEDGVVEEAEPEPARGRSRGGRDRDRERAGAGDTPLQVLKRETFLVEFSASQANVQEILNSLLELEQLVTMQLLHIRNEELQGPLKEGSAGPEIDPETGEPIEVDPDAATFVLGDEMLFVTIRFQIIRPAEDAQEQLEELL